MPVPTLTTRYSVISSPTLHGQLNVDWTDPEGQGRRVSTGGQKRGEHLSQKPQSKEQPEGKLGQKGP